MFTNLAYTRKFIILKKEYLNIRTLNPKGHGKIELRGIRGNMSLNLENAEKDNYYSIFLIHPDKSILPMELGRIYTNEEGRGKTEFSFNLKEVESNGFSMDKINGILVMRDASILLGGYINKEDGSIERYIESIDKKNEEKYIKSIQKEVVEEPITEEPIEDEIVKLEFTEEEIIHKEDTEEKIEVEATISEEEIEEKAILEEPIEEPIEDIIEDLVEETIEYPVSEEVSIEQVFEDGIAEEQIIEEETAEEQIIEEETAEEQTSEYENTEEIVEELEILEEIQEVLIDEPIRSNEEYILEEDMPKESGYEALEYIRRLNQKNQTTNYILSILRFFPYTDPFKIDLKGYNWWKINGEGLDDYRGFLPYFSYLTGGNHKYPFVKNSINCNELIEKYRQYLFGLYNEREEVKYYLYGIPGKFSKEEHPYGGITGFNTWFEGNETEGYWLLYIDPMTGKVIHPLNPMIPND